MQSLEASGEFTAQLTPEGQEFVQSIINTPRKVVMTVDALTMSKIRKTPPGGTLEINKDVDGTIEVFKYKILRRDWKRCKLHLMELK